MDPIRAIAPIIALACFALVTIRGMLSGNRATGTLMEALVAMFLGFVVGCVAQALVRGVVDEHNAEYAKANPVRPIGWTDPSEIVEVEEFVEEAGTTAPSGGASAPESKKL
jgi:hypothetical protein